MLCLLLICALQSSHAADAAALAQKLADTDPAVRLETARQLEALGPAAKAAVPALIEALKDVDWEVRFKAGQALAKIGAEAVPTLLATATGPAGELKSGAQWVLGRLDASCVPALIEALGGKTDTEALASQAIQRIGPASVPALTASLKSDDLELRGKAAVLLGRFGTAAQPAVAELIEALKTKPNSVPAGRIAAAFAQIGPQTVPQLVAAMQHDFWEVRAGVVTALGAFPSGTKDILPALIKALKDDRPAVRHAAALSLGGWGPAAAEAVPALLAALKDEAAEVRGSATDALAKISPADKKVIAEVVLGAKDADLSVQLKSIAALSKSEAVASEVLPTLLEAVKAEDSTLRATAMRVLSNILPSPDTKDIYLTLIDAQEDKNPEVRIYAMEALTKVLTPAQAGAAPVVPPQNEPVVLGGLSRALNDEQSSIRTMAIELLVRQPNATATIVPALTNALKDYSTTVRSHAIQGLQRFGPAGRPAIPALFGLLQDGVDVEPTVATIKKIGLDPRSDVTLLTEALPGKTPESATHLATLLASMGPVAGECIPRMINTGYDKTGALSPSVAAALKVLDPDYKLTLPLLLQRLKGKTAEIRLTAVQHLGALGAPAAPAIPQLIDTLKDDDLVVREAAVVALGQIAPPNKQVVTALLNLAKAATTRMTRAITTTLAKTSPDGLPVLVAALKDDAAEVRRAAYVPLEKIPTAIPLLVTALREGNASQKRATAYLISQIGPPAKAAAPALIEMLKEPPGTTTFTYTIKALEAIGPDAIPALMAGLKDGNSEMRRGVLAVVAQMGMSAKDLAPALALAVTDENVTVRAMALRALEKLGPKGIAALSDQLAKADPVVKVTALTALSNLGAGARPALPGILALQKDESPKVRRAAITAIRQVAPEDPQVLAALQQSIKDDDPYARALAVKMLGSMGALAKNAIPTLIETLRDDDWDIRLAAASALEEIGIAAKRVFPEMTATINELYAVTSLVAYGKAQEAFRQKDADHDGVLEYAAAIKGTKKKPGLCDVALMPRWYADAEGPPGSAGNYRGYRFKLLTSQSVGAPGGLKNYVENGRMAAGHAILAYPVTYGETGRSVYMMNYTGAIYEKDLRTAAATVAFATKNTIFCPDDTWTLTRQIYLNTPVREKDTTKKGVDKQEGAAF